jgi:hypothetical protein
MLGKGEQMRVEVFIFGNFLNEIYILDNISFEFLIFFASWHVNLIDIQWESLLQYTKDA